MASQRLLPVRSASSRSSRTTSNNVAPTLRRYAGRCPPRGLISLGAARREIALLAQTKKNHLAVGFFVCKQIIAWLARKQQVLREQQQRERLQEQQQELQRQELLQV